MVRVYSNTKLGEAGKRIRLSKSEIERQRQLLLEQSKDKASIGPKRIPVEIRYARDFWRDGVYHDSYGWAWGLGERLNSICLGRTEDILKAEKSKPGENSSHSCHSKLEKNRPSISSGAGKSIVATFKKDPHFLRLLEHLLSQDKGIRATRSELKSKGYEVPLRTLARWIEQRKQKEVRNDI